MKRIKNIICVLLCNLFCQLGFHDNIGKNGGCSWCGHTKKKLRRIDGEVIDSDYTFGEKMGWNLCLDYIKNKIKKL